MKLRPLLLTSLILNFILLPGCSSPPKPHILPLSEINKKFIQYCKDEFKLDVKLIALENTLWVYYPMTTPVFGIKVTDQGPQSSSEGKEQNAINFIDGKFQDGAFRFQYDIGKTKKYTKDYGYGSNYSEEYQKAQRDILTAFQNVYFGVEATPKDSPKLPQYVVMVIADIKTGLEIENMFYFLDLKRAMSNPPDLTYDEYSKRFINDIRGKTAIIDDTEGTHLIYKEITMEDFIPKQIINRMNFKYFKSSFPPSDDPVAEFKKSTQETINAYNFTSFYTLELNDLATGKQTTINKAELL